MNKESPSPSEPFLEWRSNPTDADLYGAYIDDDEMVAFIHKRASYCDRGHWVANVAMGGLNIDQADGFPRYYMRLDIAKQEISEFLNWRINKVRSPGEDITA